MATPELRFHNDGKELYAITKRGTQRPNKSPNQSRTIKHTHQHDNGPDVESQLAKVRFEFTHPTATTVCLAGTFNYWQPPIAKPFQNQEDELRGEDKVTEPDKPNCPPKGILCHWEPFY